MALCLAREGRWGGLLWYEGRGYEALTLVSAHKPGWPKMTRMSRSDWEDYTTKEKLECALFLACSAFLRCWLLEGA